MLEIRLEVTNEVQSELFEDEFRGYAMGQQLIDRHSDLRQGCGGLVADDDIDHVLLEVHLPVRPLDPRGLAERVPDPRVLGLEAQDGLPDVPAALLCDVASQVFRERDILAPCDVPEARHDLLLGGQGHSDLEAAAADGRGYPARRRRDEDDPARLGVLLHRPPQRVLRLPRHPVGLVDHDGLEGREGVERWRRGDLLDHLLDDHLVLGVPDVAGVQLDVAVRHHDVDLHLGPGGRCPRSRGAGRRGRLLDDLCLCVDFAGLLVNPCDEGAHTGLLAASRRTVKHQVRDVAAFAHLLEKSIDLWMECELFKC